MTGSARGPLEQLIGSLPVEQFWSNYWEHCCLLVPSAQNPSLRTLCRKLFSFDQADQILSVRGPRFRDFIRMSQGGHAIPRREYSVVRQDGLVDFNVEQVLELYADGATITLNRAHQGSEALASLCVDLARDFHAHVNANVYITPPNSQGFAVHSDTHDVFLLQVEGRKKWKIQKNLDYLATPRNPNVTSDPVATVEWDEFYLDIGDAVYIPRGLLHEGIADSSHSLHITLGIHPYTWADLVRDVLAEVEGTDSLLRQSTLASPIDFEDALRTVSSRLTTRLSDTEAIKPLVSARTGPYQAGSHRGRFRKLTDLTPITLTTTVRTRKGPDISLDRNRDEVVLSFGTKSLAFPSYVSPHLELLLQSAAITAEELPSDLDDNGKLTLLRRLHSEGVIEVCPFAEG
jgi:ribosomal protein L16 Arg81 hydroxylase